MTTREVQEETERRLVRCPDSTAVYLNKLRMRGLIKGERSKEKRGWIWWVEDQVHETTRSQASSNSTQSQ